MTKGILRVIADGQPQKSKQIIREGRRGLKINTENGIIKAVIRSVWRSDMDTLIVGLALIAMYVVAAVARDN